MEQAMGAAGNDDQDVVDAEVVEEKSVAQAPTPVEPVLLAPSDYSEGGVPSFEYVRDRIENRVHTSEGSVGLAGLGGSGPDVEALDKKMAERDEAGRAKLAEIRRSMGLD
jgi:phage shock protein A